MEPNKKSRIFRPCFQMISNLKKIICPKSIFKIKLLDVIQKQFIIFMADFGAKL